MAVNAAVLLRLLLLKTQSSRRFVGRYLRRDTSFVWFVLTWHVLAACSRAVYWSALHLFNVFVFVVDLLGTSYQEADTSSRGHFVH